MMIFPAHMHPKALVQNGGEPFTLTCDLCSTTADGVRVQPDDANREAWVVLPEDWSEIEDRQQYAKKQFLICCEDADCRHEAQSRQ